MARIPRHNIIVIAGRPDPDHYRETENSYNDIWGFTGFDGIEYAIIGRANGIEIFDISTNPGMPNLVKTIDGPTGADVRDIKTYRNYAYVVYDGRESNDQDPQYQGMQVIDIRNPSTTSVVGKYTADFKRCHNIFISDDGYLYACLVSNNNDARTPMHILSLTRYSDPFPRLAAIYDDMDIHDIYVRDNIAYAAVIHDHRFPGPNHSGVMILDVSDKSNISEIGKIIIPESFTHNTWLSQDGNYLFVTKKEKGKGSAVDLTELNCESHFILSTCLFRFLPLPVLSCY